MIPIYVDPLFGYPIKTTTAGQARRVAERNGGQWCHMWTEPGNEAALHMLAQSIGLRREWFQNRKGFPHYDLTPRRRSAALAHGAVEKTLADWIKERKQ